jgi:hypothetical protein
MTRENTTLRRRHDELDVAADARRGATVDCSPSMVVQTYAKVTYPTTAKSYYACHPVKVSGTEDEGQAVTTTADADQTLYVANTLIGGRWEFSHDG